MGSTIVIIVVIVVAFAMVKAVYASGKREGSRKGYGVGFARGRKQRKSETATGQGGDFVAFIFVGLLIVSFYSGWGPFIVTCVMGGGWIAVLAYAKMTDHADRSPVKPYENHTSGLESPMGVFCARCNGHGRIEQCGNPLQNVRRDRPLRAPT